MRTGTKCLNLLNREICYIGYPLRSRNSYFVRYITKKYGEEVNEKDLFRLNAPKKYNKKSNPNKLTAFQKGILDELKNGPATLNKLGIRTPFKTLLKLYKLGLVEYTLDPDKLFCNPRKDVKWKLVQKHSDMALGLYCPEKET